MLVPDPVAGGARRWPLVVALHGRGEAMKPPREGALGWPRDDALAHAVERVNNRRSARTTCRGPSMRSASGSTTRARRAALRRARILCPYVPEMNLRSHADVADYGRYVAEVLVPRARRELPVFASPESTGIDGVSLGGATALRAGFARTDTFGAVGALQPAMGDDQVAEWVEVARAARAGLRGAREEPACRSGSPRATRTSTRGDTHLSRSLLKAFRTTSPRASSTTTLSTAEPARSSSSWHNRVLSRG